MTFAASVVYFSIMLHHCRRCLFPLFCLLLCVCGAGPSNPPGPLVVCDGPSGGHIANAARFGLFSEAWYGNYPANLDSVITVLGRTPGYSLWYQQIDDAFPQAIVSHNAGRGIRTVISMNIKSQALDSVRNDTLLREIAAGAWDSVLQTFARAARAAAVPVYLRFGYEMNCDWFPWGEKPADFIAAWRRAHGIFRADSAENVSWVFSPNVIWGDKTVPNDILPYYPGDSLVDIIGVDGYNFGEFDSLHAWKSFESIFGPTLFGLVPLGKPLWLSEIACLSDSRRPQWLRDLFAFMDANPCIEAMLWFDAHKSGEPDFRLTSDSASLSIVQAWLAK